MVYFQLCTIYRPFFFIYVMCLFFPQYTYTSYGLSLTNYNMYFLLLSPFSCPPIPLLLIYFQLSKIGPPLFSSHYLQFVYFFFSPFPFKISCSLTSTIYNAEFASFFSPFVTLVVVYF